MVTSSLKPIDYPRPNKGTSRRAKARQSFRTVEVETDEHNGSTENDPYYVLDVSQTDPRYKAYLVQRKDLEFIGRSYLAS